VEIQGELIPNRYWDLSFGYSYNDARYTQWTGSDPFNVAQPGDAICLPSSPAGSCYLNLTNNPFPQMPAQQAHVSLSYRLPVREELGEMKLTSLVYAQSREYYEPDAARDLQLFAGGLNGVSQAPYATLNLRADWLDIRRGGWNAAFFVTNVTNTLYATGKIPQLETLGFAVANYAPPRMFGVEVWKRFGP
jgi:outer membrane receptor protein involved in Fe transport